MISNLRQVAFVAVLGLACISVGSGCTVVSAAGSAATAAVSVAGTVASTAVSAAGTVASTAVSVAGSTVKAVTP